MIVWHYTVGAHLAKILKEGVIKPSTAFVPKNERTIVWFTTACEWDQTANKNVIHEGKLVYLNMEQTAEVGSGLCRIGVDELTAPYTWQELKELSGMSARTAQGLYQAAIDKGSRPGHWRGTFDSVPSDKWLAVEVLEGGVWVTHPEWEAAKAARKGAKES
jgi:hypothetical protein